jgi:hypothetical protein
VPFPKELAGKIQQWTWIGHEADGLSVMAARVVYASAEHLSLEGAADGMVKKIESTPGSRVVSPRRSETTLLGKPAIEVDLRIERERGEPLLMHGIVVLRGSELIQLLSISRADQPRGAQAWARMRDSVRGR